MVQCALFSAVSQGNRTLIDQEEGGTHLSVLAEFLELTLAGYPHEVFVQRLRHLDRSRRQATQDVATNDALQVGPDRYEEFLDRGQPLLGFETTLTPAFVAAVDRSLDQPQNAQQSVQVVIVT